MEQGMLMIKMANLYNPLENSSKYYKIKNGNPAKFYTKFSNDFQNIISDIKAYSGCAFSVNNSIAVIKPDWPCILIINHPDITREILEKKYKPYKLEEFSTN
jgi:hypothetical protein